MGVPNMKITMDESKTKPTEKIEYAAPEITLELDLETRAGTPLGLGGNDPLDLTGLGTDDYTP